MLLGAVVVGGGSVVVGSNPVVGRSSGVGGGSVVGRGSVVVGSSGGGLRSLLLSSSLLRRTAELWPAGRLRPDRDGFSRSGATNTERRAVRYGTVRAARRWRDDAVPVGVDPESSDGAATGRAGRETADRFRALAA